MFVQPLVFFWKRLTSYTINSVWKEFGMNIYRSLLLRHLIFIRTLFRTCKFRFRFLYFQSCKNAWCWVGFNYIPARSVHPNLSKKCMTKSSPFTTQHLLKFSHANKAYITFIALSIVLHISSLFECCFKYSFVPGKRTKINWYPERIIAWKACNHMDFVKLCYSSIEKQIHFKYCVSYSTK